MTRKKEYCVVRKGQRDLIFRGAKMGSARGGVGNDFEVTVYRTVGGAWVAALTHRFSNGIVKDGWSGETFDALAEEINRNAWKGVLEVYKCAMVDAGLPYVDKIE